MKILALAPILLLFGIVENHAYGAERVYDQLAALQGKWTSVPEASSSESDTITYEVVSEGKAVIEHLYGMVTVYHLDDDRTMATHYCSMGNQPRMVAPLTLDAQSSARFDFLDITNNDQDVGHIVSVAFQFINPNRFVQSWTHRSAAGVDDSFSTTFVRDGSIDGYMVEETTRADQFALIQEARVPTPADVGTQLAAIFPATAAYLTRRGDQPIGAPFSRYLAFSDTGVHFQAGFPVASTFVAEAPFQVITIPGGAFAKTTHYGSYDQIGAAYEALHAWMNANNRVAAGAPFEVYVDDPATTPANQVKTEVFYPIQ